MSANEKNVVLVHGAWADGSSWNKVIVGLRAKGIKAVTVPLPLTTLADDIAAVERTLERAEGPVVLAGHAYAGASFPPPTNPRSRHPSTSPRLRPSREKLLPMSSIATSRTRRH